jgi:hypothetical protein
MSWARSVTRVFSCTLFGPKRTPRHSRSTGCGNTTILSAQLRIAHKSYIFIKAIPARINEPSFSLPLRLFSSDTDAHAIFYVTFLLVISGYWAMVISYSIALLICWITLVFFPDWNNQASFAFGVNVKLCCPNHSTPSGVAMYSIPKTYAASAAVSSMQTCERY